MVNRCVHCGTVIPEGRMVCPMCEHESTKTCRNCGAFDVCVKGWVNRVTECESWRPVIVHCKECIKLNKNARLSGGLTHCMWLDLIMPKDSFCSYGERAK